MEMTGEYRIPAPKQVVWEALNDTEILKAAIPGCESVEKTSDTEMTATVTAAVGPVKARFRGKVTLSDLDPPNGYTISGEGQGGPAGFGKGGAKVRLEDDNGITVLRYEAQAQVGGKLAQIGARLVDGAARKIADQFFANFSQIVGDRAAVTAASAAAPAAAHTAPATPVPPPVAPAAPIPPAKGGVKPVVWISGLIVLALVVLYLFDAF